MSPDRAEFSRSYDRTTKIVSTVACLFLLVVAVASGNLIAECASALIVLLAYGYSPRGYAVSEGAIVVRRLVGNVRFPLRVVREARRTTADDLRDCKRLWGSGGMFGYYGLFRTSALGKCWWYVTNRRDSVVVVTDARTALFSPGDVDGFLAAIRAWAPGAAAPGGSNQSSPAQNLVGAWIGVAIGAAALAVVALAMTYSPGPPGYSLTPGELKIHDRLYPVTMKAAGVDVARIRVVDIAMDPEWRPAARINAFANSHYRSGWFRASNGRKVRMYRAAGTRLVLLPPKGDGAPVLLEVREPRKFVEEIRREWGAKKGTDALSRPLPN